MTTPPPTAPQPNQPPPPAPDKNKRWWLPVTIALVVIILVMLLGQLRPDDDDSATPPPSTPADTLPAEEPPADETPECVEVEEGLAARLIDKSGGTPGKYGAVAIPNHPEDGWYFVAVEMVGGGGDGETAVFQTNTVKDEAATVLGVDGFAHQFTNWPESDYSVADDGVDEAMGCMA